MLHNWWEGWADVEPGGRGEEADWQVHRLKHLAACCYLPARLWSWHFSVTDVN